MPLHAPLSRCAFQAQRAAILILMAGMGPQIGHAENSPAEDAWLRHGFTATQQSRIRDALQRGIEQKFIPGGALLIIHRGEPVFREAVGVASLETGQPFAIDAPCRIASLTKPHTATLMAMLVEQRKLAWDDPVEKYLP
ncbi:MAG TPA: serine hydrolase domain-containing protein, partial [Planctomycetaceae bacterium]|nr:serine hydrolase domain-containing protein [Planctomycetaceae bacterium]